MKQPRLLSPLFLCGTGGTPVNPCGTKSSLFYLIKKVYWLNDLSIIKKIKFSTLDTARKMVHSTINKIDS
jgi:hypothetical protein